VLYSLVRVGFFALVFAGLLIAGVEWWLAAILAAVIGLLVAYIFFGKFRDAVALDIAERRSRTTKDADQLAEDGVDDAAAEKPEL
jgi:divalent metal cation (Fe/Co/Zn/Cd) transporter